MMDGKLFLGTAHFLKRSGTDEAAYRSAVSRAYYACFIAARDLAFKTCNPELRKKAGLKNERKIRHEALQRYLKNGSTDTVRGLGVELASLCGSRTDSDYKMSHTITIDDAQGAIEDAEAFLQVLLQTPQADIGKAIDDDIIETTKNV